MKSLIIALALAASAAWAADNDGVLGHAQSFGFEIELYTNGGFCTGKQADMLRAARYLPGNRSEFTMGCWQPLSDTKVVVQFDDGTIAVFEKSAIVPVGAPARKTL